MILRELVTVLGFNVKEEGLNKLNEKMEGIKETMHRILEVYVGEKIIHGLIDGIREFGEVAHEVIDSQLLGLGAVQYQVLQHTAEMYGVQRQRFNMGLALMQRQAFEAMQGNKDAAETFARLGVSITDNNGHLKNAQSLLYGIADGMTRIQDKTERVALGEKIFGMRDIEFQNMLQNGAAGLAKMSDEALKLGFVMSEKDAAAAEEMYKNFIRLRMVMEGFRNQLFSQLAPLVNQMADDILKWVEANQALIATKIKDFAQGLVEVTKELWKIVMLLVDIFTELAKRVGGAGNLIKILIYAFLLMLSAQVVGKLFSIVGFFMQLSQLISTMAPSIMALGGSFAAIVADIMPVVALVAMLGVMLGDIWGFFHGKNSVFGMDLNILKKNPMMMTLPGAIYSMWDAAHVGSHVTQYAQDRAGKMGYPVNTLNNPNAVHQTNYITVHGASDAQATATAISSHIDAKLNSVVKNTHRTLAPRKSH